MKKVLSVIFIMLILLTFSFGVLAEPDDSPVPPSTEDTSEPSVPEETTPPETPQEPQPEESEDTSQPEGSSNAQTPSESQDTSSEETPSEDNNSSEGTVSVPVANNNHPTTPQSSSQEESDEESVVTSTKTKIYASNELFIISGSENAFSEDTIIKTTSITNGIEYSNASLALANSTESFTLYSFTNENGEEPTEKLSVSFSIPALYDIEKVAIYKIDEGAVATKLVHKINKKTAKITVQIDSLGTYAIAQLFEPVNSETDTLSATNQKEIFVIICACVLLGLATVLTTVLTLLNKHK